MAKKQYDEQEVIEILESIFESIENIEEGIETIKKAAEPIVNPPQRSTLKWVRARKKE